jgi:DNA (cytosine-5)-methyltransferase 1
MKALNLYAGLGGNRQLWTDCEVTAVEINPDIAKIYQDLYPNDKVIVGDAHDYLLQHFKEFDYIWSSPPCQTHSQIRFNLGVRNRPTKPVYPDMRLYQEIILLQTHLFNNPETKWAIENTVAYYTPLIKPQLVGSHFFWANYLIQKYQLKNREHRAGTVDTLTELKGINISKYEIVGKRQLLRNCVEPELGLHVFNCAYKKPEGIELFISGENSNVTK